VNVLSFWVEGRPVPKERARTVRTRSGKYRTYTPTRTANWETRVRLVAQAACSSQRWRPMPGQYAVEVTVHRARRAGDGDNFLKAAKDALNGVAWPDDRMVVTARVCLVDGKEPGMQVRVTRLQEAAA
jgi:Holliday junction resolvase RusA-like endonuclease